jgi:hypothetical protein
MTEQGKQMRVGAREGFAYNFVKVGLLVIVNWYEVDSKLLFQVVHSYHCPVRTRNFVDGDFHL